MKYRVLIDARAARQLESFLLNSSSGSTKLFWGWQIRLGLRALSGFVGNTKMAGESELGITGFFSVSVTPHTW